MKAARIASLFFSFLIGLFLILPESSFAQNQNSRPVSSYAIPNTNPDVPKNLHTYTQSTMIEIISSLTCIVTGVDPTSQNHKCLGYDTKTSRIGYVEEKGGLIGISGSLIAMTYTPQVNTADYVKYLADNFGVVKRTYAAGQSGQGVGFEGIRPLLNLWIVFRNIVYILFVLIFLVIGVAIMLRVKIDPRTVMTIQNQIPKIIIALVLVTFSFAIAGVLIDLMWISCYLILNLFADPSLQPKFDAIKAANDIMATPYGFLPNIGINAVNIPWHMAEAVRETVTQLFSFNIETRWWEWGLKLLGQVIGGLATIVAFLIIAVALAIALFRLWFTLIQAYVMVLLDIIIAPLWIMSGALPGRSSGFGSWFKDILSNLFAFPTVIFMFVFASRVMKAYETSGSTPFVPPLIGGGATVDGAKAVIAFGIIMITPNIVNMIKAAIKAPKIETGGIMRGVGAAAGVVGKPTSTAWKRFTRRQDPWLNRPEGKGRRILLGKQIETSENAKGGIDFGHTRTFKDPSGNVHKMVVPENKRMKWVQNEDGEGGKVVLEDITNKWQLRTKRLQGLRRKLAGPDWTSRGNSGHPR